MDISFPSLSGLLAGAAFCVKYIGIYTGFLVTFLLFQVINITIMITILVITITITTIDASWPSPLP